MRDLSGLREAFRGELLTGEAELLAYSYDAALDRGRPDAVAVVRSAREAQAVVRWCAERKVPFVARGAGTNLSGGCVALRGGVVISLARMDRILAIDPAGGVAVVEPGVVNLRLQEELEKAGRFYAPDPASFKVCTLGGNFAENAGGPRCLKYGVTTNHVLAAEFVLPDGSLERFSVDDAGPELLSLLVGAEGTLGVATKLWLRILPQPESIVTALAGFPTLDAAMECVSGIIAAGIVPRVLEAMDRMTVDSIEAYVPVGYPPGDAVLLIETEGSAAEAARAMEKVRALCARHGAVDFRTAEDEARRAKLWEGRRSAYAALARLAPNVLVEDGVVPRSRLPEAARRLRAIAAEHGIRPALLFHAGDGNLHPNIIFDERDAELTARVRRAGRAMLRACVELGGSISGEHGIGVDKRAAMAWLFTPQTLELFRRVKRAFDPDGLANPDKIFPLPDEAAEPVAPRRPLTDAARSLALRVREKAEAGEALTVLGWGTKTPDPARRGADELLSTRPLAAIRELDAANYTLTVEAGISLSELKAKVEGGNPGLFVPLPLVPGTLGGLLATKAWPGARDHILGMRVLLADGSVCELGAPVVKSVAGYDIPRLLLGSWGTLAVILEVTLKLYPFRIECPNALPPSRRPRRGAWYDRLKAAFDPEGRLNAWAASEDHADAG